jgi:hypothetical protein
MASLFSSETPAATASPAPAVRSVAPATAPYARVTVQVAGILPTPDGGLSAVSKDPAVLPARVAGVLPQGQTVFETPRGLLAVTPPLRADINTYVTLHIIRSDVPLPIAEQSLPPRPADFYRMWESLDTLVRELQARAPAQAADLTGSIIPQPGVRMPNTTLFFLAALYFGDLKSWVGEKVSDLLERLPGLSRKLSDDFQQMQRLATQDTGGWKTMFIPVYDGQNLGQLKLFSRPYKEPTEDGEDQGTRFVVEAELQKLGALQLDGVVTRRRLELTLRSHRDLPADQRTHIVEIHQKYAEISGLTGAMKFQVLPDFPVFPMNDVQNG